MGLPLKALLVEDVADDADLAILELEHAGFQVEPKRVFTKNALVAALKEFQPDIVLADYSLPGFNGGAALELVRSTFPQIPVIILTGMLGDEKATELIKAGARDYVLKTNLKRLGSAVQRALAEVREIRAKEQAEQALVASELRYRQLFEGATDGIVVLDAATMRVLEVNPFLVNLLAYPREEYIGKRFNEIKPFKTAELLIETLNQQRECEFMRFDDLSFTTKHGRHIRAEFIYACYNTDGGQIVQCNIRDITDRKLAEEALFAEQERAQVMLDSIIDAVISADAIGNITYLNPNAERLTGWTKENAVGRPFREVCPIVDATSRELAADPMALAIHQNKAVELIPNCLVIRSDGNEVPIEYTAAPIHNHAGDIAGSIAVFHDVSEARAVASKMSYLAQHDALTELPNRMLLNDRITQAIAVAKRHETKLAVLFLDLDRFKRINDSLGHAIGDRLLQSVAERLAGCLRNSDTISRYGGDEFVILLPECTRRDDAALSAEKIIATLTLPHNILSHDLHVTVSIGISVFPEDGEDADALIKNADAAMYHAKETGRNNHQFFQREMNVLAMERRLIEDSLRRSLERREFVLYYQPKVDLASGEIAGAEALLRWRHPHHGLLTPERFVPIAEDCGLMVPIGRWVLREACRQAKAWLDMGLGPTSIAVNISAVEFQNKDYIDNVRAVLKNTGLTPSALELELTESVLMKDAESAATALNALSNMGVQLAVDDFGTGYSSLSYLKRFPIDILKIDQSFVHDITTDPDDATIVRAVINMGKSLKLRVIAEGVETSEQLEFLQEEDCVEGQGYYLGRPMTADEFAKLLRAGVSPLDNELKSTEQKTKQFS